jgi:hypothetical protein
VTVPDVVPLGAVTAMVAIEPLGALGDANPPAPQAVGTATLIAVPWTFIALLLLVLLVGGAVLRSRRAPQPRVARAGVAAPPGPDLVTSAHRGSGQ